MRFHQAFGDLSREIHELSGRKGAVAQHLSERLPIDILHRDIGRPSVFADVVNMDDVGVIQCGRGARLLLEASQPSGVRGEIFAQNLRWQRPGRVWSRAR